MSIANKIVVGLVGLTVMAVIFSAMLPIMGEVTSAEDTFTNDGYFRMSEITADGDDVNITWDHTDPFKFTVNDVVVNLPQANTTGVIFPYTVMCADDWGLRVSIYDGGVTFDLVLFGDTASLLWYASASDGYDCTFTFHEGTFTVAKVGSGSPVTRTYTSAYYIDKEGDYTMKKGNVNAYLNDDSVIFATGRTSTIVSGVTMNINVQATIEDGATASILAPSGYITTDETVNYTVVSSHNNLYSFSNVTFTVTDEDTHTGTATYGQVIIPYEVTAEKAIHPDGPTTAILNMLPIIVGAGLLLGAIAFMIVTRK